jgi:hypothetical protein
MVTVEQARWAEAEFLRDLVDSGWTLERVEHAPNGRLTSVCGTPPKPARHITITQTVGH